MDRREFLSLFNPLKLAERLDEKSKTQEPQDRNALFHQAMALGIDPANLSVDDLTQIINEKAKNR